MHPTDYGERSRKTEGKYGFFGDASHAIVITVV